MYGHFFIVPNRIRHFNITENHCDEFVMNSHNHRVNQFGLGKDFELHDGDYAVEVWITNKESDNWSDHGVPSSIGEGYFVSYLPFSLIMSLDEGDELSFEINGQPITLVANQKGYRYRNFGTFGECLRRIAA